MMEKMHFVLYHLLCIPLCCSVMGNTNAAVVDEDGTICPAELLQAKQFFERENELLRLRLAAEYSSVYEYNINLTEANSRKMIQIAAENAIKSKELALAIKAAGYANIKDEYIQRQVRELTELGENALDTEDYRALRKAISNMQINYATTTVCAYTNHSDCSLALEPHIQERLSKSRDADELSWYWHQWHDKAGTPMRGNFTKYVQLTLKASNLNNYHSYADYWIHFYEDAQFEQNLEAAYKAILPLYRQVHAYVRYRLGQKYGTNIVSPEGNIPIHLLGNMWGQQWYNIFDLVIPYPEKSTANVTAEMLQQNYTVIKMFQLGDEFFQSLGMQALPATFWNRSVLIKPTDRELVCHASAWDLFQDRDVRIKMCTQVDSHYLYVVHHELGHIQYYLQYNKQPACFRDAANPGFHEAVGDVIGMSVATVKHLKRIGLSSEEHFDEQSRINELFLTALKKIVFLPFAYTLDKYRWAIFRGEIDETQWNCAFWQMRSEFSGIEPAVQRTERDFDPPAKYHIDSDVEYLRYFAAHIFQFQFLKRLCSLAGEYNANDPTLSLDNCDFYGSKAAGKLFSEFLSLGSSKHWKVALQAFTGDTEMNPDALLEYFKPLYQWLKAENRRLNVPVGWGHTDKISANCYGEFST